MNKTLTYRIKSDILYFITPTEQHARINEFQEFLKTVKFDEIKDILEDVDFTKYSLAQIYRTICFYYDNITLLQSYVSTLEELQQEEACICCTIDTQEVIELRNNFPLISDRRDKTIAFGSLYFIGEIEEKNDF